MFCPVYLDRSSGSVLYKLFHIVLRVPLVDRLNLVNTLMLIVATASLCCCGLAPRYDTLGVALKSWVVPSELHMQPACAGRNQKYSVRPIYAVRVRARRTTGLLFRNFPNIRCIYTYIFILTNISTYIHISTYVCIPIWLLCLMFQNSNPDYANSAHLEPPPSEDSRPEMGCRTPACRGLQDRINIRTLLV